tara:strand:+ start:239 stop:4963 length:4725 start_codon:yes stop_codon:yes gene_type:complete
MDRTEWKEWLNEQREKVIEEYGKTPERLIQDYRQEVELNKQYNGRQLLELLQNADDECYGAEQKHVLIKLAGNQLVIANNGTVFTKDGIKSLRFARISGKKHRLDVIGYKGLGFRSILNWAKKISIVSGNLSVQYSEAISKEFLINLLAKEPNIKKVIGENQVATLSVPRWIDEPIIKDMAYDTYIILDLNEDVLDDIKQQISELKPETLIFLNNLSKITIDTPERKEEIIAERKKDRIKIKINEKNYAKEWIIKKIRGTIPDDLIKNIEDKKDYEISIAYNQKLDDSINRLFCYFITKEKFPFPFLVHATLNLDDSRNYIVDDKINRHILDRLGKLLIEISIDLNQDNVNWDRVKFLAKRGEFGETIEEIGFYDSMVESIKDKELIPTRKGYSISSETIYYNYKDFNDVLSSYDEFKDLAFFTDDHSVINLIGKLGIGAYPKDKLIEKLNVISTKLTDTERAKIIKNICDNQYNIFGWDYKTRPSLFIDNHNNIIKSDFDLVLPPEGSLNLSFPDWVTIKFINSNLVKLLQKEFSVKTLRDLRNKLSFFNVQEYSFSNFIRSIITSGREIIKNDEKNTDIIQQLLKILFEIYKNKSIEQFPETIQVPIFNNKSVLKNAGNLYFGKEYKIGNLAYNLLKNVNSSIFLADKNTLGFNELDEDELIDFFRWLGVSQYPKATIKELKENYSEYRLYALKNLNYPLDFRGEVYRNYDELKKELNSYTKISIQDIEYFDEILAKAEIEYIFAWFIKDSNVYDIIRTGKEKSNASKLSLSLYRKIYWRTITGQEISAYVYWKLTTLSWIHTHAGKKKVSNCCLENLSLSPLIESPKFNPSSSIFRDYGIELKDINFMLLKLGIIEDIKSLSWSVIYSLLLDLPEKDPDGKIARSFYNQIIKDKSVETLDSDDEKYQEFMKTGQLFGEFEGNKAYFSYNDLFYLENITFPSSILKKKPILLIDRRVGAKKVESIFGVKQLTEEMINIKIESYLEHQLNERFQNEFENFKPFAYFYRVNKDSRKDNLRSLKNLKIILCSKIDVSSEIPDLKLNQYETLRVKNRIFLLVNGDITKIGELFKDYNFCYSISEAIMNSFKITDNETELRIKELFSNKDNRYNLLQKYHGEDSKELLEKCRSLLGLILVNKKDFWEVIFKIKKITLDENIQTDNELLSEIKKNFSAITKELYEKIDYTQYNNPENYVIFTSLFNTMGITISQFNDNSFKKINFSDYIKKEIEKLVLFYRKNFEVSIYNKLLNNTQEQKNFIKIVNEYSTFEFDIPKDTLIVIKDFFFQQIHKKYSLTEEELQKLPTKNITETYNQNYESVKGDLESQKYSTEEIINYLNSLDNEKESLLYFNEFAELIRGFKDSHKPMEDTDKKPKTNEEKIKEKLKDIEKDIEESDVPIENADPIKPDSEPEPSQKKKGKIFGKRTRISNDEKEEIGLIGEKVLYERLKKEFGKENIEWVSLNAKTAGINPNGNDHYGYDIHYKKDDKIKFIEVKSSKNEITSFNISRFEVDFGEKNKDDYEVWLVLNCMDKNNRRIINLGNVFKYKSLDESFNHNSNFLVENDNFVLSFLLKED